MGWLKGKGKPTLDLPLAAESEGKMKTLYLSGHGISLRVENARLTVRNGHEADRKDPERYDLKPKGDEYDNVVIYGHSGNISLDALKWLSKQNIQLTVLNWDGRLLTSVLIPEIKQNGVRLAQYDAARDERKVEIARKLIDAKIKNSILVLDWLYARYPEIRETKKGQQVQIYDFQARLPKAQTVKEIRAIEGNVANAYWDIVSLIFKDKFEFGGRVVGKTGRPYGAVDPINALFNYGYSMLEAQCWRAINAKGLDPYIGFNHEMAMSKASLVYDLQEPFRWIVDIAIIGAIERDVFEKNDFIRTENYNMRLRPKGAEKLVKEVNIQFTTKVQFKGKAWEWGYIIPQKAGELADFLMEKRKSVDFSEPTPEIQRDDSSNAREKILSVSYSEWKKMGYSKGTLHNLKKRAASDKPFKIYDKVEKKLLV